MTPVTYRVEVLAQNVWGVAGKYLVRIHSSRRGWADYHVFWPAEHRHRSPSGHFYGWQWEPGPGEVKPWVDGQPPPPAPPSRYPLGARGVSGPEATENLALARRVLEAIASQEARP